MVWGLGVYLVQPLDLYNGEIISYSIKDRPTYELVQEMLNQAITTLTEDDKPILHSDQGWHYQMKCYQQSLKDNGIIQSMSDAEIAWIML